MYISNNRDISLHFELPTHQISWYDKELITNLHKTQITFKLSL